MTEHDGELNPTGTTDNHGFRKWTFDDHWDYADEFDALEVLATIRDNAAQRSTYTPHADALFLATDTGVLSIGDGAAWSTLDHDNAAHTDDYTYSTTHADVDVQIDETNGVIDFVTQ